jgi:hypothetical protein
MPAELPSPLKKVALQQFPTSKEWAMTDREAAEEEERDEARRSRRAATYHRKLTIVNSGLPRRELSQIQYSQQEASQSAHLVPETQLSAFSRLSKTPGIELSSLKDSSSSSTKGSTNASDNGSDNSYNQTSEPGRVIQLLRITAFQLSQEEAAAARARAKSKCKKGTQ